MFIVGCEPKRGRLVVLFRSHFQQLVTLCNILKLFYFTFTSYGEITVSQIVVSTKLLNYVREELDLLKWRFWSREYC